MVILFTVLLDAMGIGLIFPVMPDLIGEVRHASVSEAALWGGMLATGFAAMQFLFGPMIGSLSDAYGRRPVLLISIAVVTLDYVVMGLAGSIWLLLAGRMIGGVASATHATAGAYIADISTPADKAANFGLMSAGFGAGFVLGPVIGGLLGELGPRAPFWAAAALSALNLALALRLLPETLPPARRRPFRLSRANPVGALRGLGQLHGMSRLLAVVFLFYLSLEVYAVVWSYWTIKRFGWNTGLVGLSLATYGIGMVIVQAGLVRPAIRLLGERGTVLLGLGSSLVFLAVLTVIDSPRWTLILCPLTALGEIGTPALIALASRRAGDDAQGQLQGVIASLRALTLVVMPMVYSATFRGFTAPGTPLYLPGAPFALAALLLLPALALVLRPGPHHD